MAKYVLTVLVGLLLVPAFTSVSGADTIVIDLFNGDVEEATLEFNNSLQNSTLFVDIPPGVVVTRAEVTVEGVGVNGTPSSVLDFANGGLSSNVFAFWNEGQGIYPPKVDPRIHRWTRATKNEVTLIQKDDGNLWETRTTGQGLPPYEWPIQLYRFIPVTTGATSVKVMWHGSGQNALNVTNQFHADLWLHNHTDKEWIRVSAYASNLKKTAWLNHTFDLPSPFLASDGSVDVAVAGPHSENMLLAQPGLIYTDYIGVEVASVGGIQYPRDVTLSIDGVEIATLMDNVTGPRTIGDAQDFKATLQDVIDAYTVEPDNVTLSFIFSVGGPTAGKLMVRDLLIEYEPVTNLAPVYIGPDRVEVEEDSDWTEVLDLDEAFEDDHNMGELEFELSEIIWPELPLANLRMGVAEGGNRTLEVLPASDYFGDIPLTVSVKARDMFGLETIGDLNITVLQKADRPTLEAVGVLEAHERTPFHYILNVTDADLPDDSLTFSDDSEYLDIDAETGEIAWTPSSDQIGPHTFVVTVTDRFDLYDQLQITIVVQNTNDPPVITSDLEMEGRQGEETSYTIRVEDPDVPFGDVLTYFAFADAITFHIDAGTGRITFTPTNDHVPAFDIIIRVQDTIGELDEAVLHVLVENVNDPPAFVGHGTQTHDQNVPVSLQLVVDDPDLGLDIPEIEFITITGIGPELFLPDGNGLIEFTADQSMVGEHEVTYTATDRSGLTDVITITWVIVDVNDDPIIVTEVPTSIEVSEDAVFILLLEAFDADGDPVTWSEDSDILDIDPNNGSIEFIPAQMDVGTHSVMVTVSDGKGGGSSITFDLVVQNVNDDPVIGLVEPDKGRTYSKGEAIKFSASATDEDGDDLTYTWKLGKRVLGTGTSFSYSDLEPGKHTITLEVSDPNGGLASHALTVEVTSSITGGLLLTVGILLVIIVVVVAFLMGRSRARARAKVLAEGEAEAPPDDGGEGATEEAASLTYDLGSSVAHEYETLEAPASVTEGTVKDTLDEVSIYKLEEAREFHVDEAPEEAPEDGAED